MADLLGSDLNVVPFLTAHDASEMDLVLRERPLRRPSRTPHPSIDFSFIGGRSTAATDLDVVSGRENLAQALILRLLTPRGSLAALGHPDYGSRLHELIGRPKTSALRGLCRAFVLEAVAQEPRVENKAVEFAFDPAQETPSSFVFTLAVQPRSGGDVLNLSLEVSL